MAHHDDPEVTADSWTVSLLGGFGLRRHHRSIGLPPSTTRLVAFLALQARPVERALVAGSLWIDESQDRAFGNLRSALWRLRGHASSLIVADAHSVGLASSVSVDVTQVQEIILHLHQNDYVREALLARDLLSRELLPGWSDEWILIERERHRQRSLHALEAIAEHFCKTGHFGLAIDTALGAIEIDPLRESPHRLLIRTHLAEGNYSEALRHADDYTKLIETELGITPSPLLPEAIARGDQGDGSRVEHLIRQR